MLNIKTQQAPQKKLSLDVFKDKMMTEVTEVKGGASTAVCVTLTIEIVKTILGDCHDE